LFAGLSANLKIPKSFKNYDSYNTDKSRHLLSLFVYELLNYKKVIICNLKQKKGVNICKEHGSEKQEISCGGEKCEIVVQKNK